MRAPEPATHGPGWQEGCVACDDLPARRRLRRQWGQTLPPLSLSRGVSAAHPAAGGSGDSMIIYANCPSIITMGSDPFRLALDGDIRQNRSIRQANPISQQARVVRSARVRIDPGVVGSEKGRKPSSRSARKCATCKTTSLLTWIRPGGTGSSCWIIAALRGLRLTNTASGTRPTS